MNTEDNFSRAEREWLDKAAAASLNMSLDEYLEIRRPDREPEHDPDEDKWIYNSLGEFE